MLLTGHILDSSNGVYKIENFEQHLATGQFPKQSITSYFWTFGSCITLKIREEYNQVYPYIVFDRDQKRKIRAFFNIKSKFSSLCYQTNGSIYLESGAGVSGPPINIQDVLNEESGYLENGALTVEYGVHVDAILGYHDIWIFNLYSKQFSSEQENNTIEHELVHGQFKYYSPKPLLVFHEFKKINPKAKGETYVGHCLQIANRVRSQPANIYDYQWFNIAEVGRMMNMMNVVQYCDIRIIQTTPKFLKSEMFLKKAMKLNMRQCAPRMMELWNFKELLEELSKDVDKMPGEMMKVIAARFMKEEF